MKTFNYIIIFMFLLLMPLANKAYAAKNIDVYLVYSGSDRKLQKSIKKALPKTLRIKAYNASLLMMADYSGKQKALAKVSSARVVVWISLQAHELMDKVELTNAIASAPSIEETVSKIISAAK